MEFEIIRVDENQLRQKELHLRDFIIEDVEITTDQEYKHICERLKIVKGKEKEIKEFCAGPKKQAYDNHRTISRLENEMLTKLKNFEELAKKRIGEYIQKKEEAKNLDNPLDVPKVKGISMTDTYKWEVVDETQVPRQFLTVDEKTINEFVKQTNGLMPIPGIRIWVEKQVSVRSE